MWIAMPEEAARENQRKSRFKAINSGWWCQSYAADIFPQRLKPEGFCYVMDELKLVPFEATKPEQ